MRLSSFFKVAVLPLALLLSAMVSQASVLTFSYIEAPGGPILTGTMIGDLQLDGNTFIVASLGPAYLDAVLGPSLPYTYSADFFTGNNLSALPTVTLDGTFMDLVGCESDTCESDGFLFSSGNQFASDAGSPVFLGGTSYGETGTEYDYTQWSATLDATPEPGTFALGIGAGLALLGWKRRSLA